MDDGPGDGTAHGRDWTAWVDRAFVGEVERKRIEELAVGFLRGWTRVAPDDVEGPRVHVEVANGGEPPRIPRREPGWYAGPGGYLARGRKERAASDHNHYDRSVDAPRVPTQCPDCGRATGHRTVAGLFQAQQAGLVRGRFPEARWCPACLRRRDREDVARAVREAGRDVWDQAEPMVRRHVRDGWAWVEGVIDPPIDWAVERAEVVVDGVVDAVAPVVAAAVDVASLLAPLVHTVERWRYDRRSARRWDVGAGWRPGPEARREWVGRVVRGRGPYGHGDVD